MMGLIFVCRVAVAIGECHATFDWQIVVDVDIGNARRDPCSGLQANMKFCLSRSNKKADGQIYKPHGGN